MERGVIFLRGEKESTWQDLLGHGLKRCRAVAECWGRTVQCMPVILKQKFGAHEVSLENTSSD